MQFRIYHILFFSVISFSLAVCHANTVLADNAYEIEVDIDNYYNDTLLLGYYFGKAQYVKDTVVKKDGKFIFAGVENLPAGMYMILTQPDHQFVQIIIESDDQKFKVSFDMIDLHQSLKFENSPSNDHFLSYVKFLNSLRPKAEQINKRINSDTISTILKQQLESELGNFDQLVQNHQNEIILNYPDDFISAMIKAQLDVPIPEFDELGDDLKRKRFSFYYKHYFDNIDLNDTRLLYSPFMYQKVSNYVEKLTPQIPDSINQAIDVVLGKMDKKGEAFKYFLAYFINHYAKSEFIGMDAVFVHIVDSYYSKGDAYWIEEEPLNKMIKNAKTLKPILIGKKAPNITVFDSLGNPVVLHNLDAEYIVLAFWAPDCGHCKKSMPDMVELAQKYKDDNLIVLAVCTKLMKKEASCWPMVRDLNMDVFYNVSDKYLQSRFKQIYDVTKTPKVYLLDKDKTIISKNIGPEQLDKLMVRILENEG